MNLILVFPSDFVSGTAVRLTGDRAAHIREVHRATVGKVLKVGLAGGGVGLGIVTELGEKDGNTVTLEVDLPRTQPPPPLVSLILALPRPQTFKKVLEIAGAVGIRQLLLTGSERVQKSFFSSSLLKDDSWKRHLYLGMEQGATTFVPEVKFFPKFRSVLEEVSQDEHLRILAHPESRITLWETPLARPAGASGILCAVGPEGGWITPEVKAFESRGFQVVSLGRTIHRVENAVTALLAQIELMQLSCSRPNIPHKG